MVLQCIAKNCVWVSSSFCTGLNSAPKMKTPEITELRAKGKSDRKPQGKMNVHKIHRPNVNLMLPLHTVEGIIQIRENAN